MRSGSAPLLVPCKSMLFCLGKTSHHVICKAVGVGDEAEMKD